MSGSITRALVTPVGAALLLLAFGCAKGLPPATDPDVARSALTAALDAWKDGQTPEALRQRTPPVDFGDVHWSKGARLASYVVKGEERSGQSVRFTVQLTLRQKDGPSRAQVVAYNVDAGNVVVIRPDF